MITKLLPLILVITSCSEHKPKHVHAPEEYSKASESEGGTQEVYVVPLRVPSLSELGYKFDSDKDLYSEVLAKIKYFEGFHATPYICPGGVNTIGYGLTGKIANRSSISKGEADKLLRRELASCKILVRKYVKVKLTENQLLALASFTYNCGERNLAKLVNGPGRLNSGNYNSIKKLMPLYCNAKGDELKGLKLRRAWEVKTFLAKN